MLTKYLPGDTGLPLRWHATVLGLAKEDWLSLYRTFLEEFWSVIRACFREDMEFAWRVWDKI